ncbi:MAG TPA: gluconokinase [Abditibacteriaceae bacterium]|jgi:gluconokinase
MAQLSSTLHHPTQNGCILALDIGTSSTRAITFDFKGHKTGRIAQREYSQITTPDGGVEVDADFLLDLTARCIDEVLGESDVPVVAVAVSCFWHSLMAVDVEHKPLTPVFSWADNRAAPWLAPLRATMDEIEVHARTGCVFHTSYWPAKLLWLHHTQPALFSGDMRWISFGEYLALQFLGEARVSLSMASGTGLFHQNNADWDEEMLAAVPIGMENLSPLCDAHDDLGRLHSTYHERWPALRDTKWFPAIGDGAASNIGSGCVDASRIALNVGTSAALRVVLREYSGAPPSGLWRYRVDGKRSLLGGALSNAGSVWAWARNTFNLPPDADAQIAALRPDMHNLTVLPFLAGERSPLWNANARFVLEGASLDTEPVQILRACLEATSLRFADVAQRVCAATPQPNEQGRSTLEIVASGGALDRSASWRQIVCDCIGAPLVQSCEAEASARGVALLALEACGIINDIADLAAECGDIVQPNPEHHAVYKRALARQNALYDQIYAAAQKSLFASTRNLQ